MADYVFQLLKETDIENLFLDLKKIEPEIYRIRFIDKYFVLIESYIKFDLNEIRNKLKEYSFDIYEKVK